MIATEKTWMPTHQGKMLSTGFFHRFIHYSDDPDKNEAWVAKECVRYGGTSSVRWLREQEGNWDVYGGQRLWPTLCDIHLRDIDVSDWTKFRVLDHGLLHPTVCLWVAVNEKGDRHVYREFYSTDCSIAMNCQRILSITTEKIAANYIDPSTAKRNPETLRTEISVYEANGLFCNRADNSRAGYDSVATGILSTLARHALETGYIEKFGPIKPDRNSLVSLSNKPALTFSRGVKRCFNECVNLRWRKSTGDVTQNAPKEKPVDKNDDGADCVRYAMASCLYYKSVRGEGPIKIRMLSPREVQKKIYHQRKYDEAYEKNLRRAYD